MNKSLLKKLLLNALECVSESQQNAGCNDLFEGEELLKGVSKEELKEIEEQWMKNNPKEAKEFNELCFDSQITETIMEELIKLEL